MFDREVIVNAKGEVFVDGFYERKLEYFNLDEAICPEEFDDPAPGYGCERITVTVEKTDGGIRQRIEALYPSGAWTSTYELKRWMPGLEVWRMWDLYSLPAYKE